MIEQTFCAICNRNLIGRNQHDGYPYVEGACCDDCFKKYVLTTRLNMALQAKDRYRIWQARGILNTMAFDNVPRGNEGLKQILIESEESLPDNTVERIKAYLDFVTSSQMKVDIKAAKKEEEENPRGGKSIDAIPVKTLSKKSDYLDTEDEIVAIIESIDTDPILADTNVNVSTNKLPPKRRSNTIHHPNSRKRRN